MLSNNSISLQRALASRAMRCTSAMSSGNCSRSKKSMNSHRGGGDCIKEIQHGTLSETGVKIKLYRVCETYGLPAACCWRSDPAVGRTRSWRTSSTSYRKGSLDLWTSSVGKECHT